MSRSGGRSVACYPRNMKGRLHRLVCLAVIAVLSGTPAFAAVCAEMCDVDAAFGPASSTHCSRHASLARPGAHAATIQVSQHATEAPARTTLSHDPACCRRSTAVVAVLTKSLRVDGVIAAASAPAGLAPFDVAPQAALRMLPSGSSGPPVPSRSPLVLRI